MGRKVFSYVDGYEGGGVWMVGVERGLGEGGVAGWWCLSRLVYFCDGMGDGR